MTIMAWSTLPGFLLSLASILNKLDADKRKQKEDIKKAVSLAFHNTEKYYAYLAEGNPRNTGDEFDLARDWDAAGILIEAVDQKLANRIALKSRFWREGGTWSNVQIRQAGIRLNEIRAKGMTLFD